MRPAFRLRKSCNLYRMSASRVPGKESMSESAVGVYTFSFFSIQTPILTMQLCQAAIRRCRNCFDRDEGLWSSGGFRYPSVRIRTGSKSHTSILNTDHQRHAHIRVHRRGRCGKDIQEANGSLCRRGDQAFLFHDAAEGGGEFGSVAMRKMVDPLLIIVH